MKVVVNKSYGGFMLSDEQYDKLMELKGKEVNPFNLPRHDLDLVKVVETLPSADLQVEEIPGSIYRIVEYDGFETIETPESIKWIDASK